MNPARDGGFEEWMLKRLENWSGLNKHACLGFIWAHSPLPNIFSILLFFLERREDVQLGAITYELCYLIATKYVPGISMEGDEELLA